MPPKAQPASTKNYKVGDKVFYLNVDKEEGMGVGKGWSIGELISLRGEGKHYEVQDGAKTFKVTEDEVHTHMDGAYDKSLGDLFGMSDLHSATLLYCLKGRYCEDDNMYTRMGEMIISINPFCAKPYNDENLMVKHMKQANPREQPPHIWEIARKAYTKIIEQDKTDQSILISGESGAGKTEAAKTLIEYLGRMSVNLASCNAVQKEVAASLNKKLKASNPVLESFGNAKTVRNDNSSRFGKYIKLIFNKSSGVLVGAAMEHYLLEKSRIITAAEGERCYHVFYEMLAGMSPEQKEKYGGLTEAKDFPNLAKGNQFLRILNGQLKAKDDVQFEGLVQAFHDTNVDADQQDLIFRVLSSCLWLQKLEYEADESTGKAKVKNEDMLLKIVKLLDVDRAEFEKALVLLSKTAIMEKIATVPEAYDMRDALCKALYSGVFDWLCAQLNEVIKPADEALTDETRYVGLLDIFGFEKFQVNTFEQFCINYTNESLQNHYNGYTFEADELECKQEGIAVPVVDTPDNAACLKMLDDNKTGIFACLDEACKASTSTDESFTQQAWELHEKNTTYFAKPRSTKGDKFTVKHYAQDVEYYTPGWREKNMDTLKNPMKQALINSQVEWFRTILPAMVDENDKKKKLSTVSSKFKQQMQSLRTELSATESHFVRTVKPNPQMKPGQINNATVMAQLTSAGVIETIKMKRAGYPVRLRHRDFYLRYRMIAPAAVNKRFGAGKQPADGDELKEVCREIAAALLPPVGDVPQFDIGFTKVFCKAEANDKLEGLRSDAVEDAKNISRAFIYRWALSWDNKRKVKAAAIKQRKEEEAKIRDAKREAHEKELAKQGKTVLSLPGQVGVDFATLHAMFPDMDTAVIADAVRVCHQKYGGADGMEKAKEFLLDMYKQGQVSSLPKSIKAIFDEAKLSQKSQDALVADGYNHRNPLFNITHNDMVRLGLKEKEIDQLQQVMLNQQSEWVCNQRLNVMMESGARNTEDVARDIAALDKAAQAIKKQIEAAEASRMVGEKVAPKKKGYSLEMIARFVAMGYSEEKAKQALFKARHDPAKACDLLLSAK